ncbi:MAG TPA: DUF3341 domain-containing protein [Elusimicrobiota bacterium]|nr:DUF3341 domain-containing protein [Elusimicrobiota bacterium]
MIPAVQTETVYGLMAEFDSGDALRSAAERAYQAGYRAMDAYSHIAVHGLAEALGNKPTRLPVIVFFCGAAGGFSGFFMQYIANVWHYPLNIGGRPFNSWPSFIPITFELTVLFASLGAVIGMLALSRLPQPYHPVFNVDRFERASIDGFFLCIESGDPQFDVAKTRSFLQGLKPKGVYEVQP